MSRDKRNGIKCCSECPEFDGSGPWCCKADGPVKDETNIPNWCPLPDAGGEVQS